jgi:hypothetical protein
MKRRIMLMNFRCGNQNEIDHLGLGERKIIKMDFREMESDGMDWFDLAYKDCCERGNELYGFINFPGILQDLHNWRPLEGLSSVVLVRNMTLLVQ